MYLYVRKQNKVQVQVHKKLYHEEYPIEKLDYFSLQTHIVHFLFFLFTFHYYKTVNVRMMSLGFSRVRPLTNPNPNK